MSACDRPNILLIMTDQQSWSMLSCAGNPWLHTPALDALASAGVRFDQAYATNPECLPSRFSLITGRMPSVASINDNWDGLGAHVSSSIVKASIGSLLRAAGYDVNYGGKIHLPRAFRDEFSGHSYRYFEENERVGLAEACARFFQMRRERPFFLTASLINPHDICYVSINAHRASFGAGPLFDPGDAHGEILRDLVERAEAAYEKRECPALPPNHGVSLEEAAAVAEKHLGKSLTGPHRAFARSNWTEKDWRKYSWIYCRLTEQVDREIGTILAALREAELEERTLTIFTSDHGEMNGAHKLGQKSVLYEEAVRVPLILSYPGIIPQGRIDRAHLVSNGLDLLPTLCDYAETEIPRAALEGRSLRTLAESGGCAEGWREFLVVESHHDRMVRTERFKYCRYTSGAHCEQLNDLVGDPGEMSNLAELPAYEGALAEHRAILNQWMTRTWDYNV